MKSKHLLYSTNLNTGRAVGAFVEIDPRETTSGDYGQIYDAFEKQANGKREKFVHTEIVKLDPQECNNEIFYDWELAGPDGASYRMHILPDTTKEAEQKCKEYLRRSFDVVRLSCNRVHRLIEFQLPELKHERI